MRDQLDHDHEPSPTSVGHYAALCGAALFSVLLITVAPRHSPMAITFVLGATVSCGAVAILERRTPRLGVRLVAAAIGVVLTAAVVTPPRTSNDLWSYTMYGRIVAVHQASPYATVPSDYRSDPFLERVSPIWRHRASVFGPLWVGYAAADVAIAGSSPLANRLLFQVTAAAAAIGLLVLVWRRTRSTAALAWLGLHPVFGAMAVNGGHNDLVVGLAILAAVQLSTRRRGWAAGAVLGLAALIKITALLGLLGVVLWAWRQGRRRVARTAAVGTLVTLVLGYLPFLGDASHVLARADHTVTSASPWNWLANLMVGHDAGRELLHPLATNANLDAIFYASVVVVATLALALGWRAARAGPARLTVGATTSAYTAGAQYALPWYTAWSLPLLADNSPSPLGWVVWTQAAVMLVALKLPIHPTGTAVDVVFRGLFGYLTPVVLLVAFVMAGSRGLGSRVEG